MVDEQQAFNLYWTGVVGVFAQSLLAYELGSKGIVTILQQTIDRGRPGPRILWAFGLFLIGSLWARFDRLASPYQSWTDAWPVLIAICVFAFARFSRPSRLKDFLTAKRLYENYMRANVRTEPTTDDRARARLDSGLNRSEELYRRAIASSGGQDQIYDVAVGSFQLGMLLDLQGRDAEAEQAFRQAIELSPRLGRDVNMVGTMSGCYYRLGLVLKRRGALTEARAMLGQSLALDEELGDHRGVQLCEQALADL